MDHLVKRTCLFAVLSSLMAAAMADLAETTESAGATTYCVPQTLVRGGYDNLMIDHNMIIPAADHSKRGDIYVGARLKSDPEALWLLSGITWRRIESAEDLSNAQYQGFNQLPLVVPVSVFYSPFDASALVGDVEIWIGYGLRSATGSAADSYHEMTSNERYELLWQALPPPYIPTSGVSSPYAILCLETSSVEKRVLTVTTANEDNNVTAEGQQMQGQVGH